MDNQKDQTADKILFEKDKIIDNLQKKYEQLNNVILSLPGNIYWKNTEHQYLGCNMNTVKMLGLVSQDDIIGKSIKDFTRLSDREISSVQANDEIVFSTNKDICVEEVRETVHQEGTFLSHKSPLLDKSGKMLGLVGISLNITDRKYLEKSLLSAKEHAEEAFKIKSQFVAAVSHELRTPLAGIIGLTKLLQQNNLPPEEQHQLLNTIRVSAQNLTELINNVLDKTKLENNKYFVRVGLVNVTEITEEVCCLLKSLAHEKKLGFHLTLDPHIPKKILIDGSILRQILVNLIGNAIKFTQQGEVKIEVSAHPIPSSTGSEKYELIFKISDTGPGIPANKLKLIFKPFEQLEDGYARRSSRNGTGLGLSIVAKLAQLIHAQVSVASTLDKGSMFTLSGNFEVATEKHNHAQASEKGHNQSKSLRHKLPAGTQPKILLIEDDPVVQFIHIHMLNSLGCEVDAVSSGKVALEKIDNHDFVLVDISLPDINGFQVIKALREHPKGHNLPIAALTVYTDEDERAASFEAGADEFANKPITSEALKQLLVKHLGEY